MEYTEIKSFEDACNDQRIGTELPEVSKLPEDIQKTVISFYKLTIIAKSLNGKDWKPDFTKITWKYYPYFIWSAAAGRFVYDGYGRAGTGTHLGARLLFKTKEIATYAGETFIDLYNEL